MKTYRQLLITAALLLFPAWATAQTITSAVPGTISYQGRVLNSSGGLVGAGTPVNRTVIFRIWDHPSNTLDANLIYSESQTVTISEGEFSVLIGQGAANAMNTFTYPESAKGPPTLNIANAFNGSSRYLGVTVAAAAAIATTDNEITPRQQVVSSAFALRSKVAETLGTSTSTALTVLDNGNTGVGNVNPLARFTVTGATSGTTTNTPQMIITDSADSNKRLLFGVDSTGNGTGFIQATKVGTGAQNLLLNPNGGNVGIGTASPRSILDIAPGTSATDGIRIGKWADTASRYIGITDQAVGFTFPTTGGFSGFEFGGPSSAAEGFLALHTHDSGVGSAERMRIDKFGNVGIGTNAPAGRLNISELTGTSATANTGTLILDHENNGGTSSITFRSKTNRGSDSAYISYQDDYLNRAAPNEVALLTIGIGNDADDNIALMPGGNVGIGTTTPGAKLSLGAGVANSKLLLYDDGSSYYGLGVQSNQFRLHGANSSSIFSFLNGPAGSELMTIWGTGRVGIGTNTPVCPLEVKGLYTPSITGKFFGSSSTSLGTFTNAVQYISLKSEWYVEAFGFIAVSDKRIKEVVRQSESPKDLDTIQKLKVTDYRLIDRIQDENAMHKGFIAQEVKEVIPEAVRSAKGFVPGIYAVAREVEFDAKSKTLSLVMAKAHGLKAGDMVRVIGDEGAKELKVTGVPDAKSFEVGPLDAGMKRVFVYGKQVDDFLSVDYNRIFTTGISAIQQLKLEKDAEVKALQDANETLKARVEALETAAKNLAAADQTRDAKLAAIEKLLLGSGKGVVKSVSVKHSGRGAE